MWYWLDQRRERWAELDRTLARLLHRGAARPLLLGVLVAASRLGDGGLWYAIVVALPIASGPRGWYVALQMVGIGLANLIIYHRLKHRIGRARPFVNCPDIRCCARALDQFSFPSGHMLHAVSYSLLLSHHYPAFAPLLWAYTGLVAASRVVLGLHYPSDVAVGAAIGAATAGVALWWG
jgi:undecaprenyl-diphosphatase